jgi:hypothetical protein
MPNFSDNNIMNELAQIHSNAPVILQKWAPELGAINEAFEGNLDYMRQVSTAIMLESTSNYLDRVTAMSQGSGGMMNEATQPSDVGYFKKYAINLLSAAVPNLIAPEIVSMQPMLSRVGEMRFLKILYGSNKGAISKGDTMFSMFHGGNGETNYSSDYVDMETPTIDNARKVISGNLAWLPATPGTVAITVGTSTYTDDGAGKFTAAGVTGTIDYATGAYSITLTTAAAESDDVYMSYNYNNMDVPVSAPEVNLKIEVAPIIAKSRKLKTLYSFDAAFDLSKDYGMQINNELVTYTAAQIKHEIDSEIMGDLLRIASAASTTWDSTPRTAISLRDHNESFYNEIVKAGNNIFDATKLANASFIIVGMDAANVVETMPRFRSSGIIKPVGPHLCGYLGSLPVYKNPFFPTDQYLVGWKGTGLFDAGYLYCPYMPIMTTQLIMDANFEGQRGFATSYGKKPVNSKMYSKGTITHS